MKIENLGNYLRIYPGETGNFNPFIYLGCRHKKGEPYYTVENNIVNRIVLGLMPGEDAEEYPVLKYPEGLMEYQMRDVRKMVAKKRCLNINRMGYGKTVEAIKAMRELGIKNAVVVAPKTVLNQWQAQFKRWWPAMADKVVIWDNLKTPVNENNIILVNYEKLLNERYMTVLRSTRWDMLLLDEAHRIKNRTSKRSSAVKLIPSEYKWAMTGTPILKKPDDLWSILNFLGVEYSGISYWNFVNYFCKVVEGFFGNKIVGLTESSAKVAIFHKVLEHVAISNPDLALTQGKTVETVELEMSSKQKRLYRDAKALLLDELPEGCTIANGAVQCLRLVQITSNPGVWLDGEWGTKFEYIAELLEDNPEEKIVVFSRFATTCEYLKKYLATKKIKSEMYTGHQSAAEKLMAKMTFTTKSDCRALLGTIGAMGEGVDGLQEAARIVIFIDRDWSSEINEQCEDRLNRIGQKDRVLVQYLECKGTYDKYVDKVTSMEAEDIRTLLSRDE